MSDKVRGRFCCMIERFFFGWTVEEFALESGVHVVVCLSRKRKPRRLILLKDLTKYKKLWHLDSSQSLDFTLNSPDWREASDFAMGLMDRKSLLWSDLDERSKRLVFRGSGDDGSFSVPLEDIRTIIATLNELEAKAGIRTK
jgi:hypothetical protein